MVFIIFGYWRSAQQKINYLHYRIDKLNMMIADCQRQIDNFNDKISFLEKVKEREEKGESE